MKKVLIYFPERDLSPKGGPSGYLYNLRQGLNQIYYENISIEFYNNLPVNLEENQKLRNIVPKRLKEIKRVVKYANYLKRRLPVDRNLLNYDAIHFHKTEDMYLNRDFLKEYKGKVILTSHTPCVPYQEIIGRLNPKDYRLFKKKVDNLLEMDRYAFRRADYVIFPCKEAEEPYFHTWPEYKNIRDEKKIKYLPTGIKECNAKQTRKEYRKKYGIPENAFVISYAGRHNEIKGYGDLKKIGEILLREKDVYFLIAGREEPMTRIENDHWIEVGWTNDPHSLISASDVFVLPNHETYFDLILLEVLSLGIPVVMSSTGGNKYFQKFGLQGLKEYCTIEEACKHIKEIKSSNVKDITEWKNEIKGLFCSDFTIESFASNYIRILQEIVGNGNVYKDTP